MSGSGNYFDNAMVESFSNSVRAESVHDVPLTDLDALRQTLFENNEVECDRTRYRSTLRSVSPDAFNA